MEQCNKQQYVMALSYALDRCPQQWQKFVKHVTSLWHNGLYSAEIREILNRELIEYGAIYWDGPHEMGGPYVIFDQESEATRFILLWS